MIRRIIKNKIIMVGGSIALALKINLMGLLISKNEGMIIIIVLYKPNRHLNLMKELLEDGQVVSVIDKCYRLTEVADALKYFSEGNTKGKLVITVEYNF